MQMATGVFLSSESLRSFSAATRSEILVALGVPLGAPPMPASMSQGGTESTEEPLAWSGRLTPLDDAAMAHFMETVSSKTGKMLKLFAESEDGRVDMKELKRAGEYGPAEDLRGFLAALTRRIRNVTKNPTAAFWDWVENDEEGVFWLHSTTLESLRRYFVFKQQQGQQRQVT